MSNTSVSKKCIDRPQIGVGVLVCKGNKVLLSERIGAHGAGTYGSVGGHLEHGESFVECALREVSEECGLTVETPVFQVVGNIDAWLPKHYVLIGMTAEWKSGEPQHSEPECMGPWQWYSLDALPEPLFASTKLQIDALKSGALCSDIGSI